MAEKKSWSDKDWKAYSSATITGKTTEKIYSAVSLNPKFDPKGIIRESRDSENYPESTPIIIGLDVTGSMSHILNEVAQQLGDLVREILDRKPVSDPHIMFNAIGDSVYDDAPFQATQFEGDIRIAEQLTQLYFERGGGPNKFESYPLAWYFAANHTSTDNYEKRGKKGFLFTMGDDSYPEHLCTSELKQIFDDTVQGDIPVEEVLTQVNRKYEVFHLLLKQGNSYSKEIEDEWIKLLGQNAIVVSDYTKIPQIIVSILETMAGKSVDEVADSWDGSTAVVVRDALKGLSVKQEKNALVEF